MCLRIKTKFVAKKDIVVYKLGFISQTHKDMYVSLYKNAIIPFNELYKDPLYVSSEFEEHSICEDPYIFGGFLHAYTNIEIPDRIIASRLLKCNGNPISERIFKAIIPKGSVGYYGKNKDICANRIIIINPKLDSYKELPDKYRL